MMCVFESGARGTFEACRSMVGPESQNSFEVYGTKGSIALELRADERAARLHRRPSTSTPGSRPCSAAIASRITATSCPGSANSIGFEDLICIEDHEFLQSVAAGRQHTPGFAEALAYVVVQDAVLRSWDSGTLGRRRLPEGGVTMGTTRLTTAAGDRPLPDRPAHGDRRRRGAAVPRRVRDLRARQRHEPRAGAAGGRRRAADVARPERAGHGARRRRLRQGDRRRQIMVATSSIGPGALNMVTAAGVAHANRLPVLLLAGDTFASRLPDPVLQQVEHFGDPTITVNDAFKSVSRYWDRITRPEQLMHSLPHAVATMLDPADCGPAFLALPQDVQAEAFDFPDGSSRRPCTTSPGRAPTSTSCARAADVDPLRRAAADHRRWRRALLAAPRPSSPAFAEAHNIPVVETVAGKASPARPTHPLNAGPVGVTGCTVANALAGRGRRRSSPSAPGCRTSPPGRGRRSPPTPSCRHQRRRLRRRQALARCRSSATPARRSRELTPLLDGWTGPTMDRALRSRDRRRLPRLHRQDRRRRQPGQRPADLRPGDRRGRPQRSSPSDYALAAAGGFPGELINGWRAKERRRLRLRVRVLVHGLRDLRRVGSEDGAARRRGDHVRRRRLVPDDEQRPVQLGAVGPQADRDRVRQRRLRRHQPAADQPGRRPFNNQLEDTRHSEPRVRRLRRPRRGDGLRQPRRSTTMHELEAAFDARPAQRPHVRDRAADRRRTRGPGAARSGRSACPRSAIARRCRPPRQRWSVDYNSRGSEHDGEARRQGHRHQRRNTGTGRGDRPAGRRRRCGRSGDRRAQRRPRRGAGRPSSPASARRRSFVEADMADAGCAAARSSTRPTSSSASSTASSTSPRRRGATTCGPRRPSGFEQMMAVNVRAPFFLIQAAAEVMRREGVPGRSSTSARQRPRRPAVHPQLLRVEGCAGDDDPQPGVLADAAQGSASTRSTRAGWTPSRRTPRSASSTARPTAGSNGRGRSAHGPADQAARGRQGRSPSTCPTSRGC